MEEKRYMVWSGEQEEKLMRLWSSRRCLFDANSVVSKGARHQALSALAAELSVTEEDLQRHMTSLRTQYARCLKSVARTQRQKWLARKMNFLKPFIRKRLSGPPQPVGMPYRYYHADMHNYNIVAEYDDADRFIEDAFRGDVESEVTASADEKIGDTASTDVELMVADEMLEDDDDQSVDAGDGGRLERQDSEARMTVPTPAMRRRSMRLPADDDDAVFGQLVASELRHIVDPEAKLVLRHGILTAIYDARLKQLQTGRPGDRQSIRRDRSRLPTVNGLLSRRNDQSADLAEAGMALDPTDNNVDNDVSHIKQEVE